MHPFISQTEFNNQYRFQGIQNNQNRFHSIPSNPNSQSNIQTGRSSSGQSVRIETNQFSGTRTSNNVSSVTGLPLPSHGFFPCYQHVSTDRSTNSNRNTDILPNSENSNQSPSLNIPLGNSVTQASNPNQDPEKLEATDVSLESVEDKAITYLLDNYPPIPNQPDITNTDDTPEAINLNSKSIPSKKRSYIKVFNKNNEFHLNNPKKRLKFKVPIEEQHVVAELTHSNKLVIAIKSDTPEIGRLLDAIDTEKSSFGTLSQGELSLNKNLIVGETYMNPLLLAVNNNSTKTVKLFLDRKISIPNDQSFRNQLIQSAIYNFNSEILELLLKYGITIKDTCIDDNPFLITAVHLNNQQAIPILVNYGIDINFPDKEGFTALMWAVKYGDLEWVQLLINNNANKKILNKIDLKKKIKKLETEIGGIDNNTEASKMRIRLGKLKEIDRLVD